MRITHKRIFALVLAIFSIYPTAAQQNKPLTAKQMRWQHLDLANDSVYGVSMDRAYHELLKDRKKKTVIVAIIDSGIDTLHEDLKPVLWNNSKEKGHDEDHNGYKNDKHGWNFLGTKQENISFRPGLEYFRVYLSYKNLCGRQSDEDILTSGTPECRTWLSAKKEFKTDSASKISSNVRFWKQIVSEDSMWQKVLGKAVYTIGDLKQQLKQAGTNKNEHHMPIVLSQDSTRTNRDQLDQIEKSKARMFERYSQDPSIYRAETIGDNYMDFADRYYGNSRVNTGNREVNHGTHVAGIIGAVRNNSLGMDGLADAVRTMAIRAVPYNADEYDKDVALAIRYAVDNGAKVINMSFGKSYSPQQKWVEDAMLYAASKDVLLIHASGNDASNIDSLNCYPTSKLSDGRFASNVITVGASGSMRKDLVARFSNYGKQSVDVFAPGVQIYSTVFQEFGAKYALYDGTSMAAPVVAGVAGMLRSYFPKLSASQIKDIIEQSVTRIDGYVTQPGPKQKQVHMTDLCKTGGIINAYKAVELAKKTKKQR
jgi:subtilisin family serine protease